MKNFILLKLPLCALLALPALPLVAQQTFTIASNLPPVFQAGTGVTEVFPQNTFVPFDLAPNTFASGGSGSYTYSWSPTLGLSSPTVPSPMVTFSNLAAQGQYVLTVMDGNGCTITDTVLVNFSTGIKDGHAWALEVKLFPNPSAGNFQLSLQGQPTAQALRMSVLDAMGRVVLDRELPAFHGRANYDVDLTEAGAGFYLLTLQSGSYRIARPLILR
jgi:Secretion system C-terminal sorting domain